MPRPSILPFLRSLTAVHVSASFGMNFNLSYLHSILLFLYTGTHNTPQDQRDAPTGRVESGEERQVALRDGHQQ